jgi:hypothetical protein
LYESIRNLVEKFALEIKENLNIYTEIHELIKTKLRNFEDPLGVQGNNVPHVKGAVS